MTPYEQIGRLLDPAHLRFAPGLEGQKCEGAVYYIGDRAYINKNPENLLHELAHFAEREPEKLALFPSRSWGFSPGKFWQIGMHSGWEQVTDQQVQREARVWAYQLSLLREFGLPDDSHGLVSSAVYLPAWCYYHPEEERTYKDAPRIALLAEQVERMSRESHTFEDFQRKLQARYEFLSRFKQEHQP